jgi:hypothetical protein
MADHGTRQSYADGCRCAECKNAQSAYKREYQARKAGADIKVPPRGRPRKDDAIVAKQASQVTKLPTACDIGPKEQAVLEELATLTSAETRKGAAECARSLAKILDNPIAINLHVQAAKALPGVLEELRKGSARRKGRLASVQAMTTQATG